MKKSSYILVSAIGALPLVAYFCIFHGELSRDSSVWSDFGSYVGGVYGALGFIAVIYTLYLNGRQSVKAEQDTIFYKSMELFSNKIEAFEIENASGKFKGQAAIKELISQINGQLEIECIRQAREILCKQPDKVSYEHYDKIITAKYNGYFDKDLFEQEHENIKSALGAEKTYHQRWEEVKNHIGSRDHETESMKKALNALGSVWFYKVSFDDRKSMYSNAVASISHDHGAFIDGYVKNLEFLGSLINSSFNKELYLKFIKSQVSRYEALLIFCYVMSNHHKDIYKVIADLGLAGVDAYEVRLLMVDLPSTEELEKDLEHIKAS